MRRGWLIDMGVDLQVSTATSTRTMVMLCNPSIVGSCRAVRPNNDSRSSDEHGTTVEGCRTATRWALPSLLYGRVVSYWMLCSAFLTCSRSTDVVWERDAVSRSYTSEYKLRPVWSTPEIRNVPLWQSGYVKCRAAHLIWNLEQAWPIKVSIVGNRDLGAIPSLSWPRIPPSMFLEVMIIMWRSLILSTEGTLGSKHTRVYISRKVRTT